MVDCGEVPTKVPWSMCHLHLPLITLLQWLVTVIWSESSEGSKTQKVPTWVLTLSAQVSLERHRDAMAALKESLSSCSHRTDIAKNEHLIVQFKESTTSVAFRPCQVSHKEVRKMTGEERAPKTWSGDTSGWTWIRLRMLNSQATLSLLWQWKKLIFLCLRILAFPCLKSIHYHKLGSDISMVQENKYKACTGGRSL